MCDCVAFGWRFIGPCRVHQQKRSRAHQQSRRFQGLPTLVMREEHGQRVPCDPRQVTRVEVPYPPSPSPPPTRASWADTHHPPPEDTPLLQVNYSSETSLGKPYFDLQIWIRGRSSDTRWPWRAFLAKRHLSTRSGSRASDWRWMTSALP